MGQDLLTAWDKKREVALKYFRVLLLDQEGKRVKIAESHIRSNYII